jgi:hypothetical protein
VEKGVILFAEGTQAQIRTHRFGQFLEDRPADGFPLDGLEEHLEGGLIVDAPAHVHPGVEPQEEGGHFLCAGQQGGDDREIRVAALAAQGSPHLPGLPGAEAFLADEDGAGSAFLDRLLQEWPPGFAAGQAPAVEK